MPSWYDIVSRPPPSLVATRELTRVFRQKTIDGTTESLTKDEDEAGVLVSQAYFHGLIQAEIDSGIPADRIVLGGFSQGGAMAIFAGLTAKVKLAGIVALSSYLLLSAKFQNDYFPQCEVNKQTPILMCHGSADPVVPTFLGKLSLEKIKTMGFDVTWKEYPYVISTDPLPTRAHA